MKVYLLHFHERINPDRPAQHYLGSTNDLDRRIWEHRQGVGARLCEVAKERGIGFTLAEVWVGGRRLERQLKRQKNGPKFCPICENLRRRGGLTHAS